MKIAYLLQWDFRQEDGVLKKLREQCWQWLGRGHQVAIFGLAPELETWAGLEGLPVKLVRQGSLKTRFGQVAKATELVERWGPELVYLRFGTYYPGFEVLARHRPVVLEINTDDMAEFKRTLPAYQYLYHRAFRARLLRAAQGMVFVTTELAQRFAQFAKPSPVIANGIDLQAAPELPAPTAEGAPRLVFVGSEGCPWHGLDKVCFLADRRPDWQFDVVGCGPPRDGSVSPSNITFHGHCGRAEYGQLLARAAVGIGTLALYRKDMDEACALKVREYLASGLPTIIGHRDTDFPEPAPFLLELPNDAESIGTNLERIDAFVAAWRGRRVSREAVTHLDVGAKEQRRLEFFQQVLAGCQRAAART